MREDVAERRRLERTVRNRRLAQFGYATYRDYLCSPAWWNFRREYFDDPYTPKRCLCGENIVEQLVLHHKTYARIGAELYSDLQPLCDGCHRDVHRMADLGLAPYDLEDYASEERAQRYAREFNADRERRGEKPLGDRPFEESGWRRKAESRRLGSKDRREVARNLARQARRFA